MKLILAFVFVFSTSAFAQDPLYPRQTNSLSTATTPVGTTTPQVQYVCCVHKNPGNNQCEMKIETGSCKGNSWRPVANIKRCLAQVPGYISGAPIAGIVSNGAYVLNPCPF